MIYLDCERMKHPDTGLYHFCLNLASSLIEEAQRRGVKDFGLYLPKDKKNSFGSDIKVKTVGAFDRVLLYDPRIKLWHTTTQLSRYQPKGCKKVLTIHDLNFLYEPISDAQKQRRLQLVKKNLKGTDAIVAISNFTKDDIKKHLDIGNIPLEVIYNGCDVYKGQIIEPANKPKGKFLFAIGTVLPKKNFHVLPPLLRGNDYELYIGGIFDSQDYADKIINVAREYGVEDRVHLLGSVPEAQKHWYLKHCEAFLHPSIAEGFGLPVIEAMQYGRPVFLSVHTSLPEIGGQQAYYFNHDFEPDAMLREFEAGMKDFGSGDITAESVRERALSFSWDEAARRYFDLYQRLL